MAIPGPQDWYGFSMYVGGSLDPRLNPKVLSRLTSSFAYERMKEDHVRESFSKRCDRCRLRCRSSTGQR
jgi:hypothetical protein